MTSATEGEGLARLVTVMDRLRSPGGCPWDAEQTHLSLAPYALEEVHELLEAIETGSRADLREELGDVLLQVVFHARVAADHPDDPFDIDDVATAVADKLVERHPHVFAGADATTAEQVNASWERIKKESKGRESVMDGIPAAQPALARAQKVISRASRASLDVRDPAGVGIGPQLLALVARAHAEGVDAEAELRQATRDYEASAREAERASAATERSST
ncbi:MazG family protein [Demequina muriae]|uniref:MazG family protein n=1 Tax=Demequina muriae TaxID=3051664 RepID=A0ABT8GF49_9MICO|nr:MazG family protein [Demequina sp. EGI L300058]MDN4480058.1 MazG family protein [Demequina sp. EGI L300058]